MIYISQQPELFAPTLIHSDIPNELYHHGIKGQRWGVRRYQNSDGSLTEEGRIHYGKGIPKVVRKYREKSIAKGMDSIKDTRGEIYDAKNAYDRSAYNFRKASKQYSAAGRRLSVARNDLDAAIEKGRVSIFGNRLNVRAAQYNYDKSKQAEIDARHNFQSAENELDRSKVKLYELEELKSQQTRDTSELLKRYINKYGKVTAKELVSYIKTPNHDTVGDWTMKYL